MGRTASGTKDDAEKMLNKDSTYKGKIENKRSLKEMQDPAMYKATKQAISRFYSATGAIERNIKLADMAKSVYGVASQGEVFLNGAYFDRKDSAKSLAKEIKSQQNIKWLSKNNKPLSSVIHHEMAHAIWTSRHDSPKHKLAGKEISQLNKKWLKDKKKTGYGEYSRTNINEFWAEVVSKAVSGNQDAYTKAAKKIIKKYKL